ncbi:MAG: hypothetical protein H0Z28_02785 [Archaeoglobus sp.]|nr:hypothetical protein [Archaeoglobus sp.]
MDEQVELNLRERTLIDLFSAFEGAYGPSFECKYYPCHFSGQDCTFCYCPFYPCLNYDMGGEIKLTSEGKFVWSCQDCWLIHDKKFAEDVILALSRFPRQRLVEEDWFFFNSILQELIYGEVVVKPEEGNYNLMEAVLAEKECEECEDRDTEILAVRLDNFSIGSVRRITNLEEAENEVLIPLKEKNRYYGFMDGAYVVCRGSLRLI